MTASPRVEQRGQVLVFTAAVLTFLFLPLCVFLIDSALVEASHAQLGETLQAAAEDGASVIDEGAYRESGGQRVVLDQSAARATCEQSLQASGLPGLGGIEVRVTATTVTATATVHIPLLVVGSTDLTETRRATFAVGS